jgi:hypothetical protein
MNIMKGNLRTWILSLGTAFMIFGFFLILIYSTFAMGNENLEDQLIDQLPENIPDFVKNILAEEGVDLEEIIEDLKDNPELRFEMREKVMNNPKIREKFQEQADEELEHEEFLPEAPEDEPIDQKDTKRRSKDGGSVDEYYKSIVNNNLFRSLGWGGENKAGPPFRLIGTVISRGKNPKALIFEFASNRTHYVAVGEKIGNAKVESIDEKSVTINQDDQEEPLKLNIVQESPFLGGSVGDRRGGRPQVGVSSAPKNVRSAESNVERPGGKLREKLEKMSREDKEQFIQKMREDRRRDGVNNLRRVLRERGRRR